MIIKRMEILMMTARFLTVPVISVLKIYNLMNSIMIKSAFSHFLLKYSILSFRNQHLDVIVCLRLSSAAFFISSSDSFLLLSISWSVKSYNSYISKRMPAGGRYVPLSHPETVLFVTPSFSPSCS